MTFSSHFTNRPIHKDKRRRPRMGRIARIDGGRGGGSRFVAAWMTFVGRDCWLIEREREREEPDGTRNGAISRRLHSDKGLNALMGRPIETSHLTSSASALVALYGLLLLFDERASTRQTISISLPPSPLSTNLKHGKLKSKLKKRKSLV